MASTLPPKLLQRLQKRGIIVPKEDEEVFAESYDQEDESKSESSKEKHRGGAPGCPNKHILAHICTDFCFDHWQDGYPDSRLSEKYLEQRKKMLRNYPLPKDWTEVYDPGMHRHYYWNQVTDEVCWLSPRHPKAVISEAAPKIAKEMWSSLSRRGGGDAEEDEDEGDRRRDKRGGKRERYRGRAEKRPRGDELALAGSDEEESRPVMELSDRDRLKRAKRRGIDPMDPSAYGEAPEGSWTTGLAIDQEVKTGVDVTASGPLFQSRPYPAPGAILRKQNPDMYKDK